MKKLHFFLLVAIFMMGLFLCFCLGNNLEYLATDSGWDVGYDSSPGGGTTPSGGYNSGSDKGSGSYSNIGLMESIKIHLKFWLLFLVTFVGICIVIIPIYSWYRKLSKKISKKLPKIFYRDITFRRIKELPKTVENQQILDEGYQIYLDVQKAWMNFDYQSLRDLVTDELYNSYYNQLEVLKLKNQKNVMHDFSFKESHLVKKIEEHGITTVEMILVISFYDYVISSKNQIFGENEDEKITKILNTVVRGDPREKVEMTYSLTFVYQKEASSTCPNCGFKLEKGEAFCSYCKTNIQTPTKKMRLSKKQALRQK